VVLEHFSELLRIALETKSCQKRNLLKLKMGELLLWTKSMSAKLFQYQPQPLFISDVGQGVAVSAIAKFQICCQF
jgi:hypothetical protein